MKFFFPGATSPAEAEQGFEKTRTFAIETLGWDAAPRRIYKLTYTRSGKTLTFEVGQPSHTNQQPVLSIVDSKAYLVFTETRGDTMGMAIFVAKDEVVECEEFEEFEGTS